MAVISRCKCSLPFRRSNNAEARARPQASDDSQKSQGRNITSLSVGREASVALVLDKIAQARGEPLTSIALAYILHKTPYVFPIIGGREVSQLMANISALLLDLSDAEMEQIENAYAFDIGFPHNLMSGPKAPKGPGDNLLTQIRGQFDFVEAPRPIKPHI